DANGSAGRGTLRPQAVVLHRDAADQVLLDDTLEHRLGARVVPDAVGPDDRDRSTDADLQAIGLGPLHAPVRDEPELAQPPLEVRPRRLAGFARAAALLFR